LSIFNSDSSVTVGYRTITEALAAAPGQKTFATMWRGDDDSETVTFGEFKLQASAFAQELLREGVATGERVIVIMEQGIPLMAAFAGTMMIGAVPAILAYPNFKVDPAKYRNGLAGVSANLRARLVLVDGDFPEDLLDCISADGATVKRFGELPESGSWFSFDHAADPDDLAFIQHSAGTTGLQKGVALSHGAVLRQLDHLAERLRLRDDDRIYSWLPLYHDMGLIACFMLPLVYHLPVMMQSPTDWVMQPRTMPELITADRSTIAWVPNFALQLLARRVRPEDRADFDLSSMRALINCSEPVRAQSHDEFLSAYADSGFKREALLSSYAMAENVFAVTQSPVGFTPKRIWVNGAMLRNGHIAQVVSPSVPNALCFVSSGTCIAENRVEVTGDDGEPVDEGQVGELAVTGDSVFTGYYNRPDLTARALRGGWYWTGDLGFVLDGEVYVIGRKKDLIIVGGKNIYPQDVEEIVYAHPSIHDGRAVALGHYNEELGTEDILIIAEVESEADLANATEIERNIKAAVISELGVAARAIYLKPPRWVVKSTAGKPSRSDTREKFFAEHPEVIGVSA